MTETPATTKRTPAQARRLRTLTNAANWRTPVVLYVCTTDPQTPAINAVRELRRHAGAREWEVADVILETSPLATPLGLREKWVAVRNAITEKRAEGIVALQGHACEAGTEAYARLLDWLAQHAAFLSVAEVASRDRTERTPA